MMRWLSLALLLFLAPAAQAQFGHGILWCANCPTAPVTVSVGPRVAVGPQAITCPAGAVNVNTSQNLQTLINGNAAGTTYCLAAGTYANQSVTSPKNGDTYVFLQGAIFDGGNTQQFAFLATGAVSITVLNCTAQNYNSPQQRGIIDTRTGGGNSLIKNCLIQGGAAVGIEIGGHDQAIANKITNNQEEGYACGDSSVMTDNEISFNNPNNSVFFQSTVVEFGGGKCWSTTNNIYRFNWVHDNHGPGAWWDSASGSPNQGADISNNLFENNWGQGIFWEVSGYGHIHHNVARRNETQFFHDFDPFDGQITISSSTGLDATHLIEIDHNTVTDNYCATGADGATPARGGGITMMSQNRTDAPYRAAGALGYNQVGTRFVYVHDNTEDLTQDGCGGAIGPANDFNETGEFVADINHVFFDFNTYTNSTGKAPWWWNGTSGNNFATWRGFGQDPHSTAN